MFCSKCGTQLANDAKFCSKCGSPTDGGAAPAPADAAPAEAGTGRQAGGKKEKAKPLFVVKPKLVAWAAILGNLFGALFASIFIGMFLSMFLGALLHKVLGLSLPAVITIVALFVLCLFAFFATVPYLVKKKTYQKTRYAFYRDHLVYFEGFWTVEKKVVRYEQITDIHVRRGVIQKKYNLGTIILSTKGIGPGMMSGIRLVDLPKVDAIADRLNELLGLEG